MRVARQRRARLVCQRDSEEGDAAPQVFIIAAAVGFLVVAGLDRREGVGVLAGRCRLPMCLAAKQTS